MSGDAYDDRPNVYNADRGGIGDACDTCHSFSSNDRRIVSPHATRLATDIFELAIIFSSSFTLYHQIQTRPFIVILPIG